MEKKLHILLVEDSIDDVNLIEHLLKKEGLTFTSLAVESRKDYEQQLKEFKPDVVISDHSLPQFNSMEALDLFKEYKRNIHETATFILVTGTVSEEFAVEAIKSGADDYILKDRLKRLPSAVRSALEKNRLKEQKRKAEEEKLQLLDILQRSQNELFVFDAETLNFTYVNEEALSNLGYTRQEVLKMTPMHLMHEFEEGYFNKVLESTERSKKGRIYETYGVRKDGSKYPIQIHLQLIRHGNRKSFLANVLDITDSKEHEQQKELALFIQNCFNENRSLETSLEIILKELCHRSGVISGEIWGKDFEGESLKKYASWDKENRNTGKSGRCLAEKAMEKGEAVLLNLQEECNYKNQQHFSIEGYKAAMAFPIKSGNEIANIIVLYDDTYIKERNPFINLKEGVQDKLAGNIKRKKTEEELQKIFELSPDILTILGKDGYVRKVNPALQKLLGYSNEEMMSMSYDEIIHPDDVYVLDDWRNLDLAEDEVAYYESRWLARNGKYKCFAWSVTPFLKEELHFAIGRDITGHKEQVKAIRTQNEKLADIAWEQSHIVRAPLTRLMTCVGYLEGEVEYPKEILESIKTSAYEVDKILRTIITKTEAVTQHEEY